MILIPSSVCQPPIRMSPSWNPRLLSSLSEQCDGVAGVACSRQAGLLLGSVIGSLDSPVFTSIVDAHQPSSFQGWRLCAAGCLKMISEAQGIFSSGNGDLICFTQSRNNCRCSLSTVW